MAMMTIPGLTFCALPLSSMLIKKHWHGVVQPDTPSAGKCQLLLQWARTHARGCHTPLSEPLVPWTRLNNISGTNVRWSEALIQPRA